MKKIIRLSLLLCFSLGWNAFAQEDKPDTPTTIFIGSGGEGFEFIAQRSPGDEGGTTTFIGSGGEGVLFPVVSLMNKILLKKEALQDGLAQGRVFKYLKTKGIPLSFLKRFEALYDSQSIAMLDLSNVSVWDGMSGTHDLGIAALRNSKLNEKEKASIVFSDRLNLSSGSYWDFYTYEVASQAFYELDDSFQKYAGPFARLLYHCSFNESQRGCSQLSQLLSKQDYTLDKVSTFYKGYIKPLEYEVNLTLMNLNF